MLSGGTGKLTGADRSVGASVAATVGALAGSEPGLGVVTETATCVSKTVTSVWPEADLSVEPGRMGES
jgi:hypothetical protein